METIDQKIEVNADIRRVYNQWTQFEDFPEFMDGIQQVRQLNDRRLHWVAEVGGQREEWDAEIFDQVPDQRIAWRSISGRRNDGLVRFEKVGNNRTQIHLTMIYDTEGFVEKIGDALGVLSSKVKGDMERFKEFIERHPEATGAWRGEIHGANVDRQAGADVRSKRLRQGENLPSTKMP